MKQNRQNKFIKKIVQSIYDEFDYNEKINITSYYLSLVTSFYQKLNVIITSYYFSPLISYQH